MNRLATTLGELKSNGGKAFVPFVTAGDPSLEDLPLILSVLAEAEATAIEIGIPYSDPIADGPVIQASSQRALDKGVTLDKILATLGSIDLSKLPPVVLMGYANTAYHRGYESFCQAVSEVGVSGVLLSDLPADEAADFSATAKKYQLGTVFLASPTSTEDRILGSAKESTGFVYAVSRTGVTGASQELSQEASGLVKKCQSQSSCSVLLGFGLSNAEQIRQACEISDGAIVGSALVKWLEIHWNGPETQVKLLEFASSLSEGCKSR